MVSSRLRALKVMVPGLLVLLALQYELGMAVNISNPPQLAPIALSSALFPDYLRQAGGQAVAHAVVGSVVGIISLITLILSLRSEVRGVQIFGVLAFLAVALAGITGSLFVSSGFQNDGYSHGMATNFILSFAFYFLELYTLKPGPKT